jgi:phage terminase large subunit GpA-like protein
VGTDTAKELIFARLKIEEFGAGYMHFNRKINDEEYFKQLTAEKITTKFVRGFPARVWTKTRPRNEALDLNVYALAALAILNPNWTSLQANVAKKSQPKEDQQPQIQEQKQPFIKPNRPQKARSSWAKSW